MVDKVSEAVLVPQACTLPDYLAYGLDIVFVGINPGIYSVSKGHYFATPTNRFWPAVRKSLLVGEKMRPETDARILEFGVGLTDLVKRSSQSSSDLRSQDFRFGAMALREKMMSFQPRIVCFQGITGYRHYLRYAEEKKDGNLTLGLQPMTIGLSRVFLVPNPSAANAVYSLEDLVGWFVELGRLRDQIRVDD